MGSPRVDVVFRLWQCDKENHGWCEGLPLTVAAKFRSEDPAFTLSVKTVSNEKRILRSIAERHHRTQNRTLAGILPFSSPCLKPDFYRDAKQVEF